METTLSEFSKDELLVYNLIKEGKISQRKLLARAPNLGSAKYYEGYKSTDSTLRQIRKIVRDLRFKGVKILSDRDGFWICKSPEEAQEYLARLEQTAKSQAKSHLQTYHQMKKNLGIESDYFERQQRLFEV